jgi:CheY-like chemotaxis protein
MLNTIKKGGEQSVLIVDDDEFSRAIIRKKLVLLGISNIQEASDGHAGVRALNLMQCPPDFLICDIFMPDMDGIEFVTDLIKRNYPGGLILVTGVMQEVLEAAKLIATTNGIKVLGTFIKPIQQDSLRKAMGFSST